MSPSKNKPKVQTIQNQKDIIIVSTELSNPQIIDQNEITNKMEMRGQSFNWIKSKSPKSIVLKEQTVEIRHETDNDLLTSFSPVPKI